MPAARISMRQITEVLRLKYEAGLSHERIARACGLSKGVVGKYVSLAQVQGVTWPLPEDLDEVRLYALLFPAKAPPSRFAEPDYFEVHQELKTKGVTLQLLWAEYVERHGDKAYRYSNTATTTASGVAGSASACDRPIEDLYRLLRAYCAGGGPLYR